MTTRSFTTRCGRGSSARGRIQSRRSTGLANNLLPLCQPGTTPRSLVVASVIVALTFFAVMLISIVATYLYGVFFVNAVAPDTSEPFYRQPFVWGVAATAVALATLLMSLLRR
jgi:hypothetical protein